MPECAEILSQRPERVFQNVRDRFWRFDEDHLFKRHHRPGQPHGRIFLAVGIEPLVPVPEVIHRMEKTFFIIDAADKPGVFQTVRAADGLPLLFALDLQGRPVLAPAKQDEEQPRLVDAAEPDGFLDAAGKFRFIRDLIPVLRLCTFPHGFAVRSIACVRNEKALMPRRFDDFKVSCAAQFLECVLHIFVWQGQECQRTIWELPVCRADKQQIFCRTVFKDPHDSLPPHRPGFCRAGCRSRSDPCRPSSSSGHWSSRCCCRWSAGTAQ